MSNECIAKYTKYRSTLSIKICTRNCRTIKKCQYHKSILRFTQNNTFNGFFIHLRLTPGFLYLSTSFLKLPKPQPMSALAINCFYTNNLVVSSSLRAISPKVVMVTTDSTNETWKEVNAKGFKYIISKSSDKSLQKNLEMWAIALALPNDTEDGYDKKQNEIAHKITKSMLQKQNIAPFPTLHFFKDLRMIKWESTDVYMLRYCVIKSECCLDNTENCATRFLSIIFLSASKPHFEPIEGFRDTSAPTENLVVDPVSETDEFLQVYGTKHKRKLAYSGFFVHESENEELGTGEELFASARKFMAIMGSLEFGEVRSRFPFTRSYKDAEVNISFDKDSKKDVAWLPIYNEPLLNKKSIFACLCNYNARTLSQEVQLSYEILFACGVACNTDDRKPYAFQTSQGATVTDWNEEKLTKIWGPRVYNEIPVERFVILANLCGNNCGRQVAEFVWKNTAQEVFDAFTKARKGEPVPEGVPIDAIKTSISRNVGLLFCSDSALKKRLLFVDPFVTTSSHDEPASKRPRKVHSENTNKDVATQQKCKVAGPPGTLYDIDKTTRLNLPHKEHERLKFLQDTCANGGYIEMFFSPDGMHCFYGDENGSYTRPKNTNPDLLALLPEADLYGPIFKFDNIDNI